MLRKLIPAALAAALLAPVSATATTWDALGSFNGLNPAGQFRYIAYTSGLAAGPVLMGAGACDYDIICLEGAVDESKFAKAAPTTPDSIMGDDGSVISLPKDQLIIDPEQFGATVLFIAPASGIYNFSAMFNGLETLNTGVRIFRAQTGVTPLLIGDGVPHDLSFSATAELNAGQFFGFFIGPGREGNHDVTGLNFTVSDGVPEPGTWALLICGFAAAGTALRRRALAA